MAGLLGALSQFLQYTVNNRLKSKKMNAYSDRLL